MPLTPFQIELFRLLAMNRSQEGYVAGATVLHAQENSPRFSNDIDIFHDQAESVQLSFKKDASVLNANQCQIEVLLDRPNFVRARIQRGNDEMRLEWTHDSSWRFYPLERDELMGAKLSLPDLAANKVLAAADRSAPRDIIDLLLLEKKVVELGYLIWAACGKDEGLTPPWILDQMRMNSRFIGGEWQQIKSVLPLDPVKIKADWLAAMDKAESLCNNLPAESLGCLFVHRQTGLPVAHLSDARKHFASLRGAWPRLEGQPEPVDPKLRSQIDQNALNKYPKDS